MAVDVAQPFLFPVIHVIDLGLRVFYVYLVPLALIYSKVAWSQGSPPLLLALLPVLLLLGVSGLGLPKAAQGEIAVAPGQPPDAPAPVA